MEKNGSKIRNVVFGIALIIIALSVASLIANFIELSLYRPVDFSNEEVLAEYKDYQSMVAGLLLVVAIFSIMGIAFAIVSLKVKKLKLASMIVFAAIALIILIFTIVVAAYSFYYITDDMKEVTTPIYLGGSSFRTAVTTMSSGFASAALQPCVCFAAMAVCSLFSFIADVKERRESNAAPAVNTNEEYKNAAASDNNSASVAPAPKFCKNCGARLKDGAAFCTVCGKPVEKN